MARDRAPKQFGDRLAALVEERESQLVLGLDPDPAKLWPSAIEVVDDRLRSENLDPAHAAAMAVAEHCKSVIAAVGSDCVGVKLQLACFERLGGHGWFALEQTVQAAQAGGLIVIADGKRGDVPVSASAYGQMLFGSTASPFGDVTGLGVDAATANPLLGADSLQPIVDAAVQIGSGVFVLARTSNPGAADLQELTSTGDGASISDHIATLVDRIGADSVADAGLSAVGAVVGATAPEHLKSLRAAMPRAIFLIPGVGAQGGRVEDLGAAFAGRRASALITVSRALVNAGDADGGDHEKCARAAAAELRTSIWAVSG